MGRIKLLLVINCFIRLSEETEEMRQEAEDSWYKFAVIVFSLPPFFKSIDSPSQTYKSHFSLFDRVSLNLTTNVSKLYIQCFTIINNISFLIFYNRFSKKILEIIFSIFHSVS